MSRLWLVIGLLLLVPIIPFAICGEWLEARFLEIAQNTESRSWLGPLTMLLLSADLLLPVPSSGLITFVGAQLGAIPASIWSTLGLTLGCIIGFEAAYKWGHQLVIRFCSEADVARLSQMITNAGATTLIITRPLPILAEAAVLLLGCGQMSRMRFYPLILITNLLICVGYSTLGAKFENSDQFEWIVIGSLFLPLFATLLLKKFWKPQPVNDQDPEIVNREITGK